MTPSTPSTNSITSYDAVVVGAGQGGGPLSTAFARAGLRTALVEREHVGGTCVNVGCTPTKTMVASARVAYLARRAADYGVRTGPVEVDLARVRQRKRDIVSDFRAGSERQVAKTAGLDLLRGEARFVGPRLLEVTLADGSRRRVRGERIVLNTGQRPARPPIPGLDDVPTLDSTSIMELDAVPEHLLVLGGGYVGLEFGQMFRRFGSRVTVVQRGPRLLAREDADVAEAVADVLRQDGVDVRLNTAARRVAPGDGGRVRLSVEGPDGASVLDGSHLLVATGRVPNTDALDPAAGGVAVDAHGFIPTDDRLATNVPGVYAIGDARRGPAFTHISYDDFRVLRTNLVEGGDASIAGRLEPYTVYIDPQLGRIGLGEEQARASGRAVRVARMPMAHVARAIETDETRGFMKVVVDAASGAILGAAILGIEGGELMSMLEVAMLGRLPFTVLRDAIFAHPTLAEGFNNLFAGLEPPTGAPPLAPDAARRVAADVAGAAGSAVR